LIYSDLLSKETREKAKIYFEFMTIYMAYKSECIMIENTGT